MINEKAYITSSNGVYYYTNDMDAPERILSTKKLFGIFRRKGYCFFGIDRHSRTNRIIVGSRERRGTKKHNKPTTDMALYAIDPNTNESKKIANILDVHDVHQIAIHDDLIFITDCGKNRVPVYDLNSKDRVTMINIGEERDDINHVNALFISEGFLFVGLNNRGVKNSEILKIAIKDCFDSNRFQVNALDKAEVLSLEGITHSHDIELYGEKFLVSCSHKGDVYKVPGSELLLHVGNWSRAIAVGKHTLWVGSSEQAERKDRHNEDIDGVVKIYDLKPPYKLVKEIYLRSAGQVNDILLIPNN
jgi:hypothetical protein